MSLTGPIVEGAYYEREDGSVGRCGSMNAGFGHVLDDPYHRDSGERVYDNTPRLTRRVYIVPADPAEVVAELRRLKCEHWANALCCDDNAHERAMNVDKADAFSSAADLVESMLGLARCGEGCGGNCELTVPGPTKAEAELAELRAKAVEVIAELRADDRLPGTEAAVKFHVGDRWAGE